MRSLQQVDTMLQFNTMQHLQIQCIILQSLYRSTTQSIILPANLPFLIQTEVRVSTECGAYNKLIQFYSVIHCNTYQYNVAFPNTLYRSHNQIVFLPAKHTVFRTILGRFSTECGMYNKLIQFYSVIQCNTYSYNASLFKVCIVQPHKVSFYPQTRRFWYKRRFESLPSGNSITSWYNVTA